MAAFMRGFYHARVTRAYSCPSSGFSLPVISISDGVAVAKKSALTFSLKTPPHEMRQHQLQIQIYGDLSFAKILFVCDFNRIHRCHVQGK